MSIKITQPCPYCKGTDLIITEADYHGHTFYHLHHSNYHSGDRKCSLLIYDWDKENLIEELKIQIENKPIVINKQ